MNRRYFLPTALGALTTARRAVAASDKINIVLMGVRGRGRGLTKAFCDQADVNVTYDWKINAEKPLLRYFSFIMKPIFSANHRWAMKQGEKSLQLELARRHATTEAERAQVPAPPQATTSSSLPLLLIGVAAVAGDRKSVV